MGLRALFGKHVYKIMRKIITHQAFSPSDSQVQSCQLQKMIVLKISLRQHLVELRNNDQKHRARTSVTYVNLLRRPGTATTKYSSREDENRYGPLPKRLTEL